MPHDGTIRVERKPYRTPLPSKYKEPELPDVLEDSDWIYRDFGKSLAKQREELPPRDDIIEFNEERDLAELMQNIKLDGCPEELKPKVIETVKDFWDVFATEGLRKHIRGHEFHVDTANVAPVDCGPPRYGPQESRIINDTIKKMEQNDLIEDDDGPWGAMIVLAAKPHQGDVHYKDYQWRLCVSFRRLNQVTRPFKFPIARCDDAVEGIDPRAKYYIALDMDSGYWQIAVNEQSRAKLSFYTPEGKKRFTVMPMGATNASAVFTAMMHKFRAEWNELWSELDGHLNDDIKEWDKLADDALREHWQKDIAPDIDEATRAAGLCKEPAVQMQSEILHPNGCGAKLIMDDLLLYGRTADATFKYLHVVLTVLRKYRATLKLRKSKWFAKETEFVAIDVTGEGNKPAKSKFDTIKDLPAPATWYDLRMIIGLLGFYSKFIPNYEIEIAPWRHILAQQPKPGECSIKEENERMKAAWTPVEQRLFEDLKRLVTSGPTLDRPDPDRLIVVKTDWCCQGMGAVILQADSTAESLIEERRISKFDADGKPRDRIPVSNFDRTINGLRLKPIRFVSRRCTSDAEKSYHSYIGEAATVRWAVRQFHRYLYGREFLLLGDCSGLSKFFDPQPGDELSPNHQLNRWRAELLAYQFTMEHRPAKMMYECDLLSRYNRQWEEYRRLYGTNAPTPSPTNTQPSTKPVTVNVGLISYGAIGNDTTELYSWREMTGFTKEAFDAAQRQPKSAIVATALSTVTTQVPEYRETSQRRGISNAPAWTTTAKHSSAPCWFANRSKLLKVPAWYNKPS